MGTFQASLTLEWLSTLCSNTCSSQAQSSPLATGLCRCSSRLVCHALSPGWSSDGMIGRMSSGQGPPPDQMGYGGQGVQTCGGTIKAPRQNGWCNCCTAIIPSLCVFLSVHPWRYHMAAWPTVNAASVSSQGLVCGERLRLLCCNLGES